MSAKTARNVNMETQTTIPNEGNLRYIRAHQTRSQWKLSKDGSTNRRKNVRAKVRDQNQSKRTESKSIRERETQVPNQTHRNAMSCQQATKVIPQTRDHVPPKGGSSTDNQYRSSQGESDHNCKRSSKKRGTNPHHSLESNINECKSMIMG